MLSTRTLVIIKTDVYVASLCNLILLFFTTGKFNHKSRIVASSSKDEFWRRRDYLDLKQF